MTVPGSGVWYQIPSVWPVSCPATPTHPSYGSPDDGLTGYGTRLIASASMQTSDAPSVTPTSPGVARSSLHAAVLPSPGQRRKLTSALGFVAIVIATGPHKRMPSTTRGISSGANEEEIATWRS